ncbi:MAG: hypothetical protein ACREE6_12675 [Limisphaerales bacterium]
MNGVDATEWQYSPPWIVFDPDTKAEFVTLNVLRYYVVRIGDEWFICDRFNDLAVPGTKAKTRAKAIRLFYELNKRPMPEDWNVPATVNGTDHDGIS